MSAAIPVLARLTGRCADGAERDGGRRIHVVLMAHIGSPSFQRALCGVRPGRTSGGYVEVDGAENPTCPRCRARADRLSAHGVDRVAQRAELDRRLAALVERDGPASIWAEMLAELRATGGVR